MVFKALLEVLLLSQLFWSYTSGDGEPGCSVGQVQCNHYSPKCIDVKGLCNGHQGCRGSNDEAHGFCYFYKQKHLDWRRHCDDGLVSCYVNGSSTCLSPIEVCAKDSPCIKDHYYHTICPIFQGNAALTEIYEDYFIAHSRDDATNSELASERFVAEASLTLQHEDCPQLYTRVGDDCLSFLTPVNVSWGVAKEFCNLIDGELLSVKDFTHFLSIKNFMERTMIANDFWIGGRYRTERTPTGLGWYWLNEERMPIGFPMWAKRYQSECRDNKIISVASNKTLNMNNGFCYHYYQTPEPKPYIGRKNFCVAMTFEHNFQFTDEDCMLKKGPLCISHQKPTS